MGRKGGKGVGSKGRRPRSQSSDSLAFHTPATRWWLPTSAAATATTVTTASTIAGMPLPDCQLPLLVQRLGCQPAQLGQEMQ